MKKLKIPSEIVYIISIIILAFSVAMLTAVDFGISMIVAPAYILSVKLGFITFGQAEYIIQALAFIIFCFIMRKFKPVYLMSFLTCIIYGAVLDLMRLIPIFNPNITAPGSMDLWLKIIMFVAGVLLTSFSIALCFKTYLYPQVYDMFVREVSQRYNIKNSKFKLIFDLSMLAIGTTLTLVFFGKFVGVYWGTLIMACINGPIIGLMQKLIDKTLEIKPLFPKFAEYFKNESIKPKEQEVKQN